MICPLCSQSIQLQSENSIPYPENPPGRHVVVLCKNCGVGVMHPPETAEEAAALYSQGGYWEDRPLAAKSFSEIAMPMTQSTEYWNYLLSTAKLPEEVRILDVGAGEGCFGLVASRRLKEKLVQYCAVEPDTKMRNRIDSNWKKWSGATFHVQSVPSLEEARGSFDVIALSHILEHLREPKELLLRLKHLMASGGLIFFEIPHNDYRFKQDVTGHLTFWGKEQIAQLFTSCGYKVLGLGIFGNSPKFSPASRHSIRLMRAFEGGINTLKPWLPFFMTRALYRLNYGTNRKNSDGIWIRGVVN